ncbi:hypothetical protein BGZ80_000947 [Entomortierella chlamydospora]|uniref:MSP domain-containing protein n=1 Tax=Entomortierella chlamydospora TaxID=101097 RepID=A0A9P6MS70_9FUNG|nr:hypothetical protein BGZ79_002332 [Entomortierella chlamydospora]KAG0011094.1 hypothetical protein BGZ80_000947 [Entomortierella chlamydospora]
MTTVQSQQTQQSQIPTGATSNGLLQISPQQFQFTASRVAPGQVSKVKLKNLSSTPVGFKFKTNAPTKYSVKPVLGVVSPGETVKVFVRSDGWINPQDKFLLQTISLNEDEGKALDPPSWKAFDPKRFIESYIPCSSVSALTIRDHEDDSGAISSSSASSPPFHAYDANRSSGSLQRSPARQQQVFERWQHSEATRPTISIGGLGRRRSSASSTCSSINTSPSTYPTLFTPTTKTFDQLPSPMATAPTTPTSPTTFSSYTSKRNSLTSNFHGSIITSTIKEEPSGVGDSSPSEPTQYLLSALGLTEKPVLSTTSKFKILRRRNRKQLLLLSLMCLICLVFGILLPYDRVLEFLGVNVGAHKDWVSKDSDGKRVMEAEVQEDIGVLTTPIMGAVDYAETVDPYRANIHHASDVMAELNDIKIHTTRQSVVVEGAI